MPRANNAEQKIIDLMDLYLQNLIELNAAERHNLDYLESLNEKVYGLLGGRANSGDENIFRQEKMRLAVLALYLIKCKYELIGAVDNVSALWLMYSKFTERYSQEEQNRIWQVVSTLPKKSITSNANIMLRFINVIDQPFSSLSFLAACCEGEIFETRWKVKNSLEDGATSIYRAVWEKEFDNIIETIDLGIKHNYLIVDSDSNQLTLKNEQIINQFALLIPKDSLNSEQKEKHKIFYIKLIEFLFADTVSTKTIYQFKTDAEMVLFACPDSGYQRQILTHKGMIISLLGAIYTELILKFEGGNVPQAIEKAHSFISNLGFYCSKSTINRVRKENLSYLRGKKI